MLDWNKIIYYLRILPTWVHLTAHNTWGIINVFFIVWVRPMRGGMVGADHPFATGINPETGKFIWHDNVLFKSNRKREFDATDDEIVTAVGEYMRSMFLKSCRTEETPFGQKDRMPPAINYIHGGVHYNGGFLIFDDPKDAIKHFSDKKFQKEFKEFVRKEKREPVTILRDRAYDREELLEFVCFLRTIFPWFSNSNGNRKRIGWGNPAPYPSINTITGNWKIETYKFYSEVEASRAPRTPITQKYFTQVAYAGERNMATVPEKFLARFTDNRVQARGEKGNLFFVDRRKIKQGFLFDGGKLPNIIERLEEKIKDTIQSSAVKA